MLSLCSKRTQKWIKSNRFPRDSLNIKVALSKGERVYLDSKTEFMTFNFTSDKLKMIHSMEIGDSRIPMSVEKDGQYAASNLFFDDKIEGIRVLSEYLCWFFDIDISSVFISKYSNSNDPMKIMDWVVGRQNKSEYFVTEPDEKNDGTSDHVANYLLSKVNHCANGVFNFKLSPNFETNLEFEGELLQIRNCHWFTLDNLFSVNCLILTLGETLLTNCNMNEFLKHWMTSGLKFKEICIEMEEVITDDLFFEIEVVEQPEDVERVYESHFGLTTIYGGFDIQRNDGVWATIDHNRFEESRQFFMIIWDEQ
uniref:FBA_2 domain-containing protein n=1 Tax=Caenorhabditis tropicalis TaxID=1561998 RepID=A0A1I7TT58_9PELO